MSATDEIPILLDAVSCGPVWVSPDEMCEVRIRGVPVAMPVPRMRMLASLLRAQGRVMSRDDLYRAATGRSLMRGSRAVELQILRLRRALGPLGRHLVTVAGAGYRITVAGLALEE